MLLLTDGGNDITAAQISEAVAEHQARKEGDQLLFRLCFVGVALDCRKVAVSSSEGPVKPVILLMMPDQTQKAL